MDFMNMTEAEAAAFDAHIAALEAKFDYGDWDKAFTEDPPF